jgi:hypothetical protein
MNRIITISIALLTCVTLYAQDRTSECFNEYMRLNPDVPITMDDDPCLVLAVHLQSEMDQQRLRAPGISPRDLQTNKSTSAQSVAAANQSDAVPALYPFALAGGSIGGSGSEGGTNALTAISLNPAIFFGDMDDPEESARLGRMMDFSVIVPLTQIEDPLAHDLQYLGVRARINMTGAEEGGKLYNDVVNAFKGVLAMSELEEAGIQELLLNAPDFKTCIAQFEAVLQGQSDPGTLSMACGEDFSVVASDEQFSTYKLLLQQLVQQADSKYFGLDLRADFGDPTLGAIDSARGTSIFAGVGYGFSKDNKKINSGSTNFNSRLGLRYKDMEDLEATIFDIDGALGIEIARPFQYQQIKFGCGLEFRTSIEERVDNIIYDRLDEALETDYLFFRAALNVPITASNSFAVQYGTSVIGDKPSVLVVNFNWKLLLED